jgi:hypothetical protein
VINDSVLLLLNCQIIQRSSPEALCCQRDLLFIARILFPDRRMFAGPDVAEYGILSMIFRSD